MAKRDYAAAGKMSMRDYAATGKELMISSTTFGQRRRRCAEEEEEYEKLQGVVRETNEVLTDLEWRSLQGERVWREFTPIKELYYKADDVLDELSYEATRRIIQMEEEEKEKEIQKYYCMMNRKVCNIINPLSLLLFRGRMSRKIKDLKTLLRIGSKGSTIIVTTKYENVASIVGTIPPYKLSGPSIEESWALVRRNVFGRGSVQEKCIWERKCSTGDSKSSQNRIETC